MKKLVVPVLANDECKSKYKDDAIIGKQIGQITERQICAGGNQGKNHCKRKFRCFVLSWSSKG